MLLDQKINSSIKSLVNIPNTVVHFFPRVSLGLVKNETVQKLNTKHFDHTLNKQFNQLFKYIFHSHVLIFLRVDHAGEYGADRIYAGQLAVLGKLNPYFRRTFRFLNHKISDLPCNLTSFQLFFQASTPRRAS